MTNRKIVAFILVLIVLAGLGYFVYKAKNSGTAEQALVSSFEDCAQAGYPVMESYPRQCRTPEGTLFVENIAVVPPLPAPVEGKCYVGGCSSQLCSDQPGAISTCIYKPEYACYKNATCERQANGSCGWTPTTQLSSCLNSATGKIAAGYVTGHVTIGPNCPVERVDQPCPTPTVAYTSREAVVYASNSTTVKERVRLDAAGNYSVALAPGKYFVQIVPAGIGAGEKKAVTVKSLETSTINFDIDTGIR